MNPAPGFRVEPADWIVDREALRQVREVVFIDEQQVPLEEEWDDLDASSRHVLARDPDGKPIGTGRLTPQRKIGRMAVLADWRGHGVGAAMLQALMDTARTLGWTRIGLNAQVSAVGFYERFGFRADGDEFLEAGIVHRPMVATLAPLTPPPAQRGLPHARPSAEPLQTSSREQVVQALQTLFAQARHAVVVHSRDLDPGVLDQEPVLDALRRVASSGRGASVRILLHDPARLLRDGHRMLPLAQRLPSAIALRVPQEDDDLAFPSAFVANDTGGYLLRPLAGRYDGRGSTCEPREQVRLLGYFEQVWQRAADAAVLRPLEL